MLLKLRYRKGIEMVEPWLRGTRIEVDAVRRGVIHALELAAEDVAKWCEGLSDEEMEGGASREASLMEFAEGVEVAVDRVLAISPGSYDEVRGVGRKMLPTSVGGLLVHCADHTQRHVGQLVTTVKVAAGMAIRAETLD